MQRWLGFKKKKIYAAISLFFSGLRSSLGSLDLIIAQKDPCNFSIRLLFPQNEEPQWERSAALGFERWAETAAAYDAVPAADKANAVILVCGGGGI